MSTEIEQWVNSPHPKSLRISVRPDMYMLIRIRREVEGQTYGLHVAIPLSQLRGSRLEWRSTIAGRLRVKRALFNCMIKGVRIYNARMKTDVKG